MFSEGRMNVHDQSGHPSLVTADLLDQVNEKIRENRRFTMSELCTHFPHISCSLLREIVTEHLQYHKAKCMGAALNFLVRYHNEGDEFLNHIVTGDGTCISHVTPENKQHSMQCQCSASPKAKKLKQTLSARKIMCTMFWDVLFCSLTS
jgi:hypothetical protein